MNIRIKNLILLLFIAFATALLSSCGKVGDKTASVSIIYVITAVLSFLLLVLCAFSVKRNRAWFFILFSSVFIVNIGYLLISVSANLAEALWANRIAYLGSVFLPFSMYMIIFKVSGLNHKKWLPYALFAVSLIVFFVAASPGYLDIYYKEVYLETVDGVSSLKKVYGPWHILYLIYLVGYFAAMICTVVCATLKKKLASVSYAVILATAVFVNIGVWLIEQFVKIDFEILSVSYIISELFLLGLNLLMRENETQKNEEQTLAVNTFEAQIRSVGCFDPQTEIGVEYIEQYKQGIAALTHTEKIIFNCYIEGKTTKEIMKDLNIKENTLKFHNKNIYHKLGVSSRKQLIEYYKHI